MIFRFVPIIQPEYGSYGTPADVGDALGTGVSSGACAPFGSGVCPGSGELPGSIGAAGPEGGEYTGEPFAARSSVPLLL